MSRQEMKTQYGHVRKVRTKNRSKPYGKYTTGGSKNPLSTTGRDAVKDRMGTAIVQAGFSIRSLPLFAQRTRRHMAYYTAKTIITGTATANAYVFSANGLYDVDITGTGGQPNGFASMMKFYNHYTVLRSSIKVVITNASASLFTSVGIYKSGSSTVLSSVEEIFENGDLAWASLSNGGTGVGSTALLTQSCDCSRYQGLDDIMDDPDMRGDSASNPAEQQYYHVSTWNPVSATQITSDFQAFLEFDVVFHEPRKAPVGS